MQNQALHLVSSNGRFYADICLNLSWVSYKTWLDDFWIWFAYVPILIADCLTKWPVVFVITPNLAMKWSACFHFCFHIYITMWRVLIFLLLYISKYMFLGMARNPFISQRQSEISFVLLSFWNSNHIATAILWLFVSSAGPVFH